MDVKKEQYLINTNYNKIEEGANQEVAFEFSTCILVSSSLECSLVPHFSNSVETS